MVSAASIAIGVISTILSRNRQTFDNNRDDALTNPISSDGILTRPTQQPAERRAMEADRRSETASPPGTGERSAAADVERAQQRLAQEADRTGSTAADDPEQARSLVERLTQQISADPRGAMRATGQVSGTLFEAATARPTV
jgi:hypothetical protein